jgi:hypothetical protein
VVVLSVWIFGKYYFYGSHFMTRINYYCPFFTCVCFYGVLCGVPLSCSAKMFAAICVALIKPQLHRMLSRCHVLCLCTVINPALVV